MQSKLLIIFLSANFVQEINLHEDFNSAAELSHRQF